MSVGVCSHVRLHASQAVWAALLLNANTLTVHWLEGQITLHSSRQMLDFEARTIVSADRPDHATHGGKRTGSRVLFVKGDVKRHSIRPRP